MNISFISKKNRAFILVTSTFYSFLIISIVLLSQFLLNSKIGFMKDEIFVLQEQTNLKFLESIMDEEINSINSYMNNNKKITSYFDTNNEGEVIFLEQNIYKVSHGGYFLSENPKEKLKDNFKDNINLTYKKEILIDSKKFLIQATLNYQTNFSRNPRDLKNEKIKRIWIIEYE